MRLLGAANVHLGRRRSALSVLFHPTAPCGHHRAAWLDGEHSPAVVVPLSLVFDDPVADRVRESFTLPFRLAAASEFFVCFGAGARRPNGVGSGSEVVLGDVSNASRPASGIRRMPSRSCQLPGSPIAWPPAARESIILIRPRVQARIASIA
jgi:hypothetical protein